MSEALGYGSQTLAVGGESLMSAGLGLTRSRFRSLKISLTCEFRAARGSIISHGNLISTGLSGRALGANIVAPVSSRPAPIPPLPSKGGRQTLCRFSVPLLLRPR